MFFMKVKKQPIIVRRPDYRELKCPTKVQYQVECQLSFSFLTHKKKWMKNLLVYYSPVLHKRVDAADFGEKLHDLCMTWEHNKTVMRQEVNWEMQCMGGNVLASL